MTLPNLKDAALVILGHGTDLNPGSAIPVRLHAAELRRRGIFAEVREAYWKQEPQIKTVLAETKSKRAFIVPLMISEGYFSEEVIPRELGFPPDFRLKAQDSRLVYCLPVGTHDSMTRVILARAQEAIAKFPFPRAPKPKDISLFIAGHGTERNSNSRKSIERQVEMIRAKQIFATVDCVFMDEEPRIPDCYTLAQTRNMVVVPFFISDGLHVMEDIPVLLGEPARIVKQRLDAGQLTWRNPTERNEKLVWYSAAVGTEPGIADVILARVSEAVLQVTIKI